MNFAIPPDNQPDPFYAHFLLLLVIVVFIVIPLTLLIFK